MDNIKKLNEQLSGKSPEDIIQWAFNNSKNPILTTNFRPYEVAILYLCSKIMPDLKVVWCDSGYNTRATYVYAEKIIGDLSLNIQPVSYTHLRAHET